MARVGAQSPTLRIARDYERTYAPVACKLMAKIGMAADEAEEGVLSDWLAYGVEGTWTHIRCFLEAPRQNLKTWSIVCRMLFGALLRGERVLYTAQNSDTANEVRELVLTYTGASAGDPKAEYPWINRYVSRVSYKTAHEAIYFRNGGRIYFSTRTDTMKLGFTVDVVVFDEAQELTEAHLSALLSTAAAAPLKNPQYVFCGTPPTPTSKGEMFQIKRDALVAGTDDGSDGAATLSEWSANDIEGFELSAAAVRNPDVWYATNPGLGTRIREDTVRAEVGSYTQPLTFAQQRLGYWLPREVVKKLAIPKETWARLEVGGGPGDGARAAMGVRFTGDGTMVALAACLVREDGGPHVEFVREEATSIGIQWLVDLLAKNARSLCGVAIEGRADATDLAQRLEQSGVPKRSVLVARASEAMSACAMLLNSVNDGTLTHLADPALAESATTATKRRTSGEGFRFSGESPERLDACALALWATRTSKYDPNRVGRIG